MAIEKLNIAIEHLDNALNCFYNREAYHSAILCAGAGQEILGKYLLEYDPGTPEDARVDKHHHIVNMVNRLAGLAGLDGVKKNSIRKSLRADYNTTKHMDDLTDAEIFYEPKGAAANAIYHAIKHYLRLTKYKKLKKTVLIDRIIDELKRDDDFDSQYRLCRRQRFKVKSLGLNSS
jgi:hypothetical protein